MAVSQNGYPACNRSVLHNPRVPGTNIDFPGGLRRGPAGDLLIWVAEQLHRRVENGGSGYGMWGFACRNIAEEGDVELADDVAELPEQFVATGSPHEYDYDDDIELGENAPCSHIDQEGVDEADAVSNHASGTAIDWHAPRHPLGRRNTYNAAQRAEIHRIEAETEGCVRWGGDWSRPDDMHWEIVRNEATCARVLAKLRGRSPGGGGGAPGGVAWIDMGRIMAAGVPVLEKGYGFDGTGAKGRTHWYVLTLQACLNVRGLSRQLKVDGLFGQATEDMVKELQRRWGLTPDGVVGPATWPWVLGNDAPEWA